MSLGRRIVFSLLAVIVSASAVAAQDDPRYAIVTSFPNPSVSFQWELTDKFALRIDGSYSFRDESFESPVSSTSISGGAITRTTVTERRTESTSHSGSIGLTAVMTIRRTDQSRLYLAPRALIGLTRQHIVQTETETTTTTGIPSNIFFTFPETSREPVTRSVDASYTSPAAGMSFGAETNVHRRLALFGEVGFTYSRSDTPLIGTLSALGSIDDSETRRTALSSRAVGGMMIRF